MTSTQDIKVDLDEEPQPEEEDIGPGHFFSKRAFHRPTYCHHCTDVLWGLIGQGNICDVCNFVCHEKCLKSVVSPCSSVATNFIKNPVSHCWSEPSHYKRKFCNVCRKRLDDSWALHCDICEYYAHVDCQDFVINNCKECATYVPQTDADSGSSSTQQVSNINVHHWREGNLPSSTKCAVCKKTCWSSEVLAGMKCLWCGMTAHSACYKRIGEECTFGPIKPIMLPPNSVTVPRMDVSMYAIYGLSTEMKQVQYICEELSSSSNEQQQKDKEKDRRQVEDGDRKSGGGKEKDKEKDKDKDKDKDKEKD